MIAAFFRRFRVAPSELAITCAVFLGIGILMNSFGRWARIAEFRHLWQIGTCYLGFVVPLALFVRGLSLPLQYCVCVTAFIPLEVAGYALGSSIAFDGNAFEALFGTRNFTAVMVAGVALIPPIGLKIVEGIRGAAPSSRPGR
ncbi:MAG TPA: hypothetical protein VGG20_00325 [Thermoanaerobaculia bacterium]|jgi:hypothetical protein